MNVAYKLTLKCLIVEIRLISPLQFMKLILTVSGKDLSTFMEQWVCRSGIARFHASFNFIRKKNMIELKLKQDIPRGSPKLVVSIVVLLSC